MGKGEPIRKEASGRYVVVIDTAAPGEQRRQIKRRFSTYKEARAWLTRTRSELADNRFVRPQKLSVAEWLDQWLDTLQLAPSTVESYRKNVRLHLEPYIGQVPLQQLTGTQISALYRQLENQGRRDHRGGGLSPRTVRYIQTILKAALKEAVQQDLRRDNPADRAHPPSSAAAQPPEMRPWTAVQLAAFLDWASTKHLDDAPAWHVLAYTGMRRGELLALRWGDVDLDAGRFSVRRSVGVVRTKGTGKQLLEGPTKGKRARVIDLDTGTVALLRKHRAERAALMFQFVAPEALVFGRLEDPTRHLHPERFSARFVDKQHQCRRDLGETAPPVIHLHELRHSHATLLLQAGVPVKVVSERLGHATVTITLETYAHVMPGMQAAAAETFAAAIQRDSHSWLTPVT